MSTPQDPADDQPELHPHAVYDRVGGMDAFVDLVETFYAKVEHDELLRPQYPVELEPGKTHLAQFLAQYFGGGDVYSARHGHPRLRMRHASFTITPEVALRWAGLMSESIRERSFPSDVEQALLTYVARATPTMTNALPDEVVHLPHPEDG